MAVDETILVAEHNGCHFEIQEGRGEGFYVWRFVGNNHRSTHDYLTDDVEQAKRCALHHWGVPELTWVQVSSANPPRMLAVHKLMYESASENDGRSSEKIAAIFFVVSLLLFVVSLSQQAVHMSTDHGPIPWEGLFFLLIGWLYILGGFVPWLANPALAVAWLLLFSRQRRTAAILYGAASLAFALSCMLYRKVIPYEADNEGTITGYALGYWLWIASILVALAGSVVMKRLDNAAESSD